MVHFLSRTAIVLALALIPRSANAQRGGSSDSCDFARDHECDEPRWGTGICADGTDESDCAAAALAHQSNSGDSKSCCGDFESSSDCCPEMATEPTSRRSSSSSSSCVSWLWGDLCDSDYLSGSFVLLLLVLCCCFPAIVFGITYATCIQTKQQETGRRPKQEAWAACCGVFWLAVVIGSSFFGLFTWFGCSFLMVLPFCMDDCYTKPSNNGALHGQQNPLQMQHMQPMVVQMPGQPQMAQQQQLQMVVGHAVPVGQPQMQWQQPQQVFRPQVIAQPAVVMATVVPQ